MSYLTTNDLRAHLKVTAATDNALLAAYIDEAAALWDRVTGRTFEAAADTTRTFDALADLRTLDQPGSGWRATNRTLWLHGYDLAQAPTTVTNGDGTVIPSSAYVTEPRNVYPAWGITLKAGAAYDWTYDDSPEGAIAVTGRWAYSVTAPADVVYAVRYLAAWFYRSKEATGEQDRAFVTPDGTMVLPEGLPRRVYDIAAMYRSLAS